MLLALLPVTATRLAVTIFAMPLRHLPSESARTTTTSVWCGSACRLITLSAMLLLAACSPRHDWREVHGDSVPWVVLLPAKPVSMAREVHLDGVAVTMTMTAARVDGTSFAVGSAGLPDGASASVALQAMKKIMLRNIQGTVISEKTIVPAPGATALLEVEATGHSPDGQPLHMVARFGASGRNVCQAVMLGHEKDWSAEAADTFLASFRPG